MTVVVPGVGQVLGRGSDAETSAAGHEIVCRLQVLGEVHPAHLVIPVDPEAHGLVQAEADGAGDEEGEGQDGDRRDDLAPQLVDAPALEQTVDTIQRTLSS